MTERNFRSYADLAMRDENVAGLRPVIEKELLHYDILQALSEEGVLKDLCFQGGTALRLCHGGVRYSEDLDFSGGPEFTRERAGDIAGAVERRIGQRYGLPVSVKPPKETQRSGPDPVRVSTWSIRIETVPERRNMPTQRIKIDIDTTRSHTRERLLPRLNYDFLPAGYGEMILPVQSRTEIMSNKVISLSASMGQGGRPRYRDVWDLRWLSQSNVAPEVNMIREKAVEHGIGDLLALLEGAIGLLPGVVESDAFRAEMSRFLPMNVRRSTVERPEWMSVLTRSVSETFRTTLDRLSRPEGAGGTDFDF